MAGFCGSGGIAFYGVEAQYALWPPLLLLAGMLPACALLFFARNAHRSFTRCHPFVEDFYRNDDKIRARKRKHAAWAAAMAIVCVGLAFFCFQTGPLQHLYGGLASLNIACACAGWLVVHATMNASRTDVAAYNRRHEERTAWEDSEARRLSLIAGRSDDGAGDVRPVDTDMFCRRVQEQRKAAAGIIMALSGIVALVMLFALHDPNWMLAPAIGALACIIAWIALPFIARPQR
ncbi:MAG: hypothetical protein Q4B69_04085 [Slackia sp.]|nr:hypothetical protein [Slackia sp.]